MRCATCKHWTPFEPAPADDQEIAALEVCISDEAADGHTEQSSHVSTLVKLRRRMGPCARTDNMVGHVDESTLAIAEDLSNHAILRTAPDFGCVQWEPKP